MKNTVILVGAALLLGFLMGWFSRDFGSAGHETQAPGNAHLVEKESSGPAPLADSGPPSLPGEGGFISETVISTGKEMIKLGGTHQANRLGTAQLLVELDAGLEGASEEDLAGLIELPEFDDLPLSVVDLVFRRWAEISPMNAAIVWVERAKDDRTNGIYGLMESWVAADPDSAITWAESLTDSKVKAIVDPALIGSLTEIDPSRALERLLSGESTLMTHDVAVRVARNLDPAEMPAAASSILAKTDGRWSSQNELRGFLEAWGVTDSGAAFDWVVDQEDGPLKGGAVSSLMRTLIYKDPAAAAEKLEQHIGRNEIFSRAGGELWMALILKGQDETAMEFLREHGDALIPPQYLSYGGGISSFKPERAKRLLEVAMELPESGMKRKFLKPLIYAVSESNPQSVLEQAMKLPAGEDTDGIIASTISNWAEKGEPEAAIRWALDNPPPGHARQTAIRFGASTWGREDPAAVAKFAMSLPENDRDGALWGIAEDWVESDSDGALEFVRNAEDPAAAGSLTGSLFWHLVEAKSGAAVLETALAMPAGKLRHDAVQGLFRGWGHLDSNGAAAALETFEPGPLRDTAIGGFISRMVFIDERAALAWSAEISHAGERRKHVLNTGRRWLRSDRIGATKWIEGSDAIEPELKAELLRTE